MRRGLSAHDGGDNHFSLESFVGEKVILTHRWRGVEYLVEPRLACEDEERRSALQTRIISREVTFAAEN